MTWKRVAGLLMATLEGLLTLSPNFPQKEFGSFPSVRLSWSKYLHFSATTRVANAASHWLSG